MNEHIIHQDSRSYITEMQLENAVLYREYSAADGVLIADAKVDTATNLLLPRVYSIKNAPTETGSGVVAINDFEFRWGAWRLKTNCR